MINTSTYLSVALAGALSLQPGACTLPRLVAAAPTTPAGAFSVSVQTRQFAATVSQPILITNRVVSASFGSSKANDVPGRVFFLPIAVGQTIAVASAEDAQAAAFTANVVKYRLLWTLTHPMTGYSGSTGKPTMQMRWG